MFDYHNLYNGGGVAVIDINNDELPDLYFTGNQVADKLYLNKGGFVFEDISVQAGIIHRGWSTGATVCDVNEDGFQDLYICRSGNESAENRKNILLINDGKGHFINEAEKRGLADSSYSNQASFFDFDHDGDLDVYVLTTSNLIRNPNLLHPKDRHGEYAFDHLYENDGTGHFNEVGKEKGITQNSHGLGLTIADVNNDGWEDILASSDFLPNDVLYINQQNGTFSNEAPELLPYQSRFSMGNDIADLNNDGLPEMISVDMLPTDYVQQKKMLMTSYHVFETEKNLGYQSEFSRNMLFKHEGIDHLGKPHFSEIGQLIGVHATDWSWAPLMVDFDNDGLKDISISNGYLRDVTNSDFVAYNLNFAQSTGSTDEMRAFMNENAASLPPLKTKNQFFKQIDDFKFENVSDNWLENSGTFANGAVFADLDNDGDLDYVVNNINQNASIFRNNSSNNYIKIKLKGSSKNPFGLGAKIEAYSKGVTQTYFQTLSRGYQSSVDPSIIFGFSDLSSVDSLCVWWSGGKSQTIKNLEINQTIVLKESNAHTPTDDSYTNHFTLYEQIPVTITHEENRFIDYYRENLLLRKYSEPGPALAVGDVNRDGLEDFYLGGNKDSPGKLVIQNADLTFKFYTLDANMKGEDADALFFDFNGDGYQDLYIAKGSNEFQIGPDYQDQFFLNDGKGNLQNKTHEILPELTHPGSIIRIIDIDNDGNPDLFRGGSVLPGHFPKSSNSYILNFTNDKFEKYSLGDLGLIKDAISLDYNDDGSIDLILVGDFMSPTFLKNNDGQLQPETHIEKLNGLWNCIEMADLDNDGDLDFILGNIGLNYRYSFTENFPLVVNSTADKEGFLPSYYLRGVEVPIPTRDDLSRQFPALKNDFPNYLSYAEANMQSLKGKFPERSKRASKMESIILWNEGKGNFREIDLPDITQSANIQCILPKDINNDGRIDLILAGNDYTAEPTNSGYTEGTKGVVLLNIGNRQFRKVNNIESGIWLDFSTKHLKSLKTKTGSLVVAARNNNSIKIYRKTQ